MHLLHLCKIRVHKVTEQNLRVEFATGICEFDMSHAVDGTFLENRKPSPVVVNVGLQDAYRGVW